MAIYTAEVIGSLAPNTPIEGATPPSEVNDAIREIKIVLLNQFAAKRIDNSTNINLAVSDALVVVDAETAGGDVTVNLPAVATAKKGKEYTIKKGDSGTNIVTVDANGSETIDGELTQVLSNEGDSVSLLCTGTEWIIKTSKLHVIPPGTKMLFYQDTAPEGWTIDDTLNDKVVYITKGSAAGGQTGGQAHSTGNWTISGISGSTDSHALSIDEMPVHSHYHAHTITTWNNINSANTICMGGAGSSFPNAATTSYDSTTAGGGVGHSHTISSLSGNGNWRPAAYNCIICTKD